MRAFAVGATTAAATLSVWITVGAQSAPTGVTPARSISHFQVSVSDLKRSQAFYTKLLGATIIDTSPDTWTSTLPGTGMWLSLTTAQSTDSMTGLASKAGTFDLGIGIDLTPGNAESVRNALKQAFPTAKIASPGTRSDAGYDRTIYVDHPDAIRIRLVSSKDDGHLPHADNVPAVPRTSGKGVVTMRNLNHLNVRARDVNRSQAFYTTLLAAPVRERTPNGLGATLTVAGGPFWLRMTTAKDPTVSLMDHPGLGIDLTPATAESVRTALKQAFPELKVYSPGTPEMSIYNRSVYIVDPDGLVYQLISHDDNGAQP